ncbi:hypothetical protein MKK88_05810 [Methylobacterium sp. E-005]|uniref:hypothetical protein n=1 Tax=Methylobacterium sp. E-005 TaxID=2836549 RepID=UPI001FB9C3E6|nr:hypothetical protein [Methylobacterium sp. E-005]MCJ2085510.1 hypothetical protein [Methylobacterium sp. E-005]
MPKITYRPQTDFDPQTTRVGAYSFVAGKAVEVSDEVHERLSKNPWFTGDKKAAERLVSGSGISPGPSSGIDSSVMPAYPPGSGMKHAAESAMTADGIKPTEVLSETDLVDNANTVEDPKEARRAGRVANKG